jgi:sulfiredoxin
MMKRQVLPIASIYVPVKRRATLDPTKVQTLAESILESGQSTPILVRPDGERFVLVEGLHAAARPADRDRPHYHDVIVRRWQAPTRDRAVHAETGESFSRRERDHEQTRQLGRSVRKQQVC